MHLIIAGHGKQKNGTFDPGATGLIKKGEHRYVVEELFPAMKRYLPKNHNVVFFSKYKVSNYGNIAELARQYNANQITEIHFDAASPSARGGHVIIHKDFRPDSVDLALRDVIKSMVGVRYSHKGFVGISGRDNLYNVNAAAKAGVTYRLIELGFGTNKYDAEILTGQVDEYAKRIVGAITGSKASDNTKTKPAPKKPSKSFKSSNKANSNAKKSSYSGNSIVEYLQSIGQPSSFAHRKKLAAKHGIRNYRGTAAQNLQLLRILRDGAKPIKSVSKPKQSQSISQMATRIINDPKAPRGHAARRKWLGIDNATYQKVRAEVNRRLK